MLLELPVDRNRRFQRAAAILPGDARRVFAAHGGKERGDLVGERIGGRKGRITESDFRRSSAWLGRQPEDGNAPANEIDRGAGLALENPHLALGAEIDAA